MGHENAQRAVIVALRALGQETSEISQLTGVAPRTIRNIFQKALERGFDPAARPLEIKDAHIEDGPRTGRPSKVDDIAKLAIEKVQLDRYGREKSTAVLAEEITEEGTATSARTVHRGLRKQGFRKTKVVRKPGLSAKMKQERLEWCLAHQHWTLEDWKNVIWSDETSVILLHRRGGYRIWRMPKEKFLRSCIRERWKGAQEFMFWGCFSYDKKGPCHIWLPETAAEKKAADLDVEKMNEALEPSAKVAWELATEMEKKLDLNLRGKPRGRKPKWSWNQKNGRLVRRQGTGVDWYRYRTKVLIPKLIPFAKECLVERPGTLVQEDKAPAHSHYIQQQLFDLHKVKRLIWPGNSPDLNAIEPCWFYMKKDTTVKGAFGLKKAGIAKWEACWLDVPQFEIQAWIERIPHHIKEIIRLEGGNEYQEGRGDEP